MSFWITSGVCRICSLSVYRFEGISDQDEAANRVAVEAAGLASLSHLLTSHNAANLDAIATTWTEEPPEAEEARQKRRTVLADRLRTRIHEWSLAHHGVAWWPRAPEALWRMVAHGPVWAPAQAAQEADDTAMMHDVDDGRADTDADELSSLLRLAEEARGWWILMPHQDEPAFLALDVWSKLYDAYAQQRGSVAAGAQANGQSATAP